MASHGARTKDCCFCAEFLGCVPHQQVGRQRIIAEGVDVVAFPSLGPLVPGHVLLAPKSHWRSVRSVPLAVLDQLLALRQSLVGLLRDEYGPVVQFEHGVTDAGSGGCGIDHAHLHLVPVSLDVPLHRLIPDNIRGCEIDGLHELRHAVPPQQAYVYVEDDEGGAHVFFPRHVASQYMRRLIAGAAGLQCWDWREDPTSAAFRRTLARLSGLSAVA